MPLSTASSCYCVGSIGCFYGQARVDVDDWLNGLGLGKTQRRSRNMNDDAPSLGRRMAKGAAWMVSMRIAIRSVGLVSMVILARLLVPEDFGLVALATMLVAALSALSSFNFDVFLIQNQNAGRRHYDTAWTLSIISKAVIAGGIILFATAASAFFEEPRLETIFYWFAVATLVEGFANIAVVNFRKDLQFHKDFAFMLGPKLGMFAVTVPLAFLWRDYWALVAGIMAGAFMRVALGYLMQPYRPRLSIAKWQEIMSFSKWLVLNNIIRFIHSKSDIFIIGKIVGTQALGLYTIAYEIATLPSSELLAPIRRALLPGYAKMADDPKALRTGFLNVFSLTLLIGLPVAAGIGLIADPLVKIMLGEKWLASIPIIQVLAIYGLLSVATAGSGPIYLAVGKPHLMTAILSVRTAIIVPLLIWGVDLAGAYGAAWALVTGNAIAVAPNLLLIMRLLKLPVGRLIHASWRPAMSVTTMAFVVIEVQAIWPLVETVPGLILELLAAVAAGAVTYVGVQLALWRLSGSPDSVEKHVVMMLRRR